jgi:hypothetical protein
MRKGSDPLSGYVLVDPYFSVSFDENDMLTVDAALACYLAHCRKELEQGAKVPLPATDYVVDHIRERLHRNSTDAILSLDEISVLGWALAHYRRDRSKTPDATAPFWAQDAYIEQVRQKLRGPPTG